MKSSYTFANREATEVEVEEKIGNIILDSRRKESNLDRKKRYHCYSMDTAIFEGMDYADEKTSEKLLEQKTADRHVTDILAELSEIQRRRLHMMGYSDIGVTLNTYTQLGLEDATDELKRVEELVKARKELDKVSGERQVSQKIFREI